MAKSAPAIGVLLAAVLWTAPGQAQVRLGEGTTVVFATVDEGRAVLTARDDYVRRLSPFDRAARLKTDRDVSEQEYLQFVGRNVLAWSDEERRKVETELAAVAPRLREAALRFPATVLFVLTTGAEEGGAAYTRGNAVVLPTRRLGDRPDALRKLVCHELFHVLSREDAALREALYATIGFVKCDEVELPGELKARQITNPDAPRNDHCIRIEVDGKPSWAVPVLYSKSAKYDVARGGEFFNYLEFRFLLVERRDDSSQVRPSSEAGRPRLADPRQIAGLYEQIGRNTSYIIHPEEILADNFALLMTDRRDVPSPAILDKMRAVLRGR